jgi:hypothetical protein
VEHTEEFGSNDEEEIDDGELNDEEDEEEDVERFIDYDSEENEVSVATL